MSDHHAVHLLKRSAEAITHLEPLHERKNPVIAFGAGLVLGALGVALYLKSAKDFFICMGLFLGLSIVIPGLGSVLGWCFAPLYGAIRAHTSNVNAGL